MKYIKPNELIVWAQGLFDRGDITMSMMVLRECGFTRGEAADLALLRQMYRRGAWA